MSAPARSWAMGEIRDLSSTVEGSVEIWRMNHRM